MGLERKVGHGPKLIWTIVRVRVRYGDIGGIQHALVRYGGKSEIKTLS